MSQRSSVTACNSGEWTTGRARADRRFSGRRLLPGLLSGLTLLAIVSAPGPGHARDHPRPEARSLQGREQPKATKPGEETKSPPRPDPADQHRVLYNDLPVLLAGYYPGLQALIVWPQVNASQPLTSTYYRQLIDTLTDDESDHHVNLLRVVLTMGMALENRPWLHPYERTTEHDCDLKQGTWCTNHARELGKDLGDVKGGGNRFDLDRFNQDFFEYWDEVLRYAEERDVIVQVALLDGAHLGVRNDTRDPDIWPPFERLGRVFDYFEGGNNASGMSLDADSPDPWYNDQQAKIRQKAFIDKAVWELGDHYNVIWEIMNEAQLVDRPSPADSSAHPWYAEMRSQIQASEVAAGHATHMIMPYDSADHSDVGGKHTPGSANNDSDYQQAYEDLTGDYLLYDAPILADNDCCPQNGTSDQQRKKAWVSLVAGAHPNLFVYTVTGSSDPAGLDAATTQQGIRYVGYVRKLVAELGIDLRGMEPRDDVVADEIPEGFVWSLASDDNTRFLVYFYDAGQASIMSLPDNYTAWWFDPVTGITTPACPAGQVFETPQPDHDWVLYIEVRPPPVLCTPDFDTLCLRENRFRVTLDWWEPWDLIGGPGHAFPHPDTDASGYFWFYEPGNLEVGVKILDGPSDFWVFHGAATSLDYHLTIEDTASGRSKTYHKVGYDPCGGFDFTTFPQSSCGRGAVERVRFGEGRSSDVGEKAPAGLGDPASRAGSCNTGGQNLCLLGDRFEVKVIKDTGQDADARELTDQSGDFEFFYQDNREILVKMIDARDHEGYFWVFYGSMTDQDYEVVIKDTMTGVERSWDPTGDWCGGIDLQAFSDIR